MTTPPRIVPARSQDLGRYLELLEEVAEWLSRRGITQWPPGSFRLSAAYYAGSIDRGEVYLAFVDDELVGTLRLLLREPIVWPDDVTDEAVYLYTLAVRRCFAGRALGACLLEWARNRAAVMGRRFVRLDCVTDSAFLRDYYTRAGFEERGDVEVTFPLPVGTLRLRRFERPVAAGRQSPTADGS